MAARNKIAVLILPWAIRGTSFDTIVVKVYSYLAKKYNYDIHFFIDNKLEFRHPLIKTHKMYSPDNSTGLYKLLWFLGLPRFYYLSLVNNLKGFDIIDTGTPEFNIYSYQAYLAAKKYNIKLFLRHASTFYGFSSHYFFFLTKSIGLHFAKKFCDNATGFMFVNPESRDSYNKFRLIDKNDSRVRIIGHPVDSSIFKPLNLKPQGKQVVLSVGALLKFKGHQYVIKAFKQLENKLPNAELWIVGEGSYRKSLEKVAASLKLKDKVKFLGKKSHTELNLIYNQSSIFVLANEQEVTPAVSEAMLCLKPVVAMECGGINFVIPNNKYGLIAKRDINDLSDKIYKILSNSPLSKRIASNGRKYILANFTIEKVAEKMHKAFQMEKSK